MLKPLSIIDLARNANQKVVNKTSGQVFTVDDFYTDDRGRTIIVAKDEEDNMGFLNSRDFELLNT